MMIENPFGNGKLDKLKIKVLEENAFPNLEAEKYPKEYLVQVNPESYRIHYQINYDRREAIGNSGSEATYNNTTPPSLEFDFLFDGTGVIPAPAGPLDNVPLAGAVADLISGTDAFDVMEELRKFSHVVYDYSGVIHRPRQIQINWGTLEFVGVLDSLQINYKLFKPDGTPLRAEAKTTFSGTIADRLRSKKENNQSPDVTHLKTTRAEDRLPIMAHQIYGNTSHYLEVAKVNKLYNFRALNAGVEIFFPPVDKQSK